MNSTWKTWVLGVVTAAVVTIAGNWSSSRIDVLEHQARALEGEQTKTVEKLRVLDDVRLSLARIETKLSDLADRLRRVETKLDEPAQKPARGGRK